MLRIHFFTNEHEIKGCVWCNPGMGVLARYAHPIPGARNRTSQVTPGSGSFPVLKKIDMAKKLKPILLLKKFDMTKE